MGVAEVNRLSMRHERERHWDSIAASMDLDTRIFYASYVGQSVLASLGELLPARLDDAAVLDIGCGTGRYFPFFASLGARCQVGVDIGEKLLAVCRRRNATVHLARSDAARLPFADQSFDIVLSMGLIEHFRDPAPILAEFTRLVRNGGILVLETPNALNLVFSLYKIIHRKELAWEHWLGPWSLARLVEREPRLRLVGSSSAVVMSWLLTRAVAKADITWPGVASAVTWMERHWPLRYFGSLMFVAARRR